MAEEIKKPILVESFMTKYVYTIPMDMLLREVQSIFSGCLFSSFVGHGKLSVGGCDFR